MHLIIVEDLEIDRERLADLLRRDCAGQEECLDLSFYASGEEFQEHYRQNPVTGFFSTLCWAG